MANNDKWVWIIAGGIMQVPLIQEAQRRGYKVLVSDRNAGAPGCTIANQVVEIDTYDIPAHLDLADVMKEKPVAVLTAGADVGPTVSAVADYLGLYGELPEVAKNCRNKLRVRRLLNRIVPQPIFLASDHDEYFPNSQWKVVCRAAGIEPYPCVVKPLEGSGSRGVSLVQSPWQFEQAIRKARAVGGRNHREILIEQKLKGEEYALDFFINDDKMYLANASYRLFHKFGVEAGHINPWSPPEEVLHLSHLAAQALNVTWGPFKVDFLNDKERGWMILEVATRLSGGFDHMYTAPLATGKDITSAMLDMALSGKFKERDLKPKKNGFACAYAPLWNPGKIDGWEIPDIEFPENSRIFTLAEKEILPINDCVSRPMFTIGSASTAFGALRQAVSIAKKVKPNYVA